MMAWERATLGGWITMGKHRSFGILLLLSLLACDGSLLGTSDLVEAVSFDQELLVFEETQRVRVTAQVGVENHSSYAVGYTPCMVALQTLGADGWTTVLSKVCLLSHDGIFVAPGSGRTQPWAASERISLAWVPPAIGEYRFVVRVRAHDNEAHLLYSEPFVMEPTFN